MKDIKLKDKIAQGINDLFYIWKREFQTTFRDQGVLILFILVPLGYPLLYSFIYDNEVVREVPAVVVDDALTCTAFGAGRMMAKLDEMDDGMINIARKRQLKG